MLAVWMFQSCNEFENERINSTKADRVLSELELSVIPFEFDHTLLKGKVGILSTKEELIVNLNEISYSSDENLSPRVFVLQQSGNDQRFDSKIINQEADLLFYKYGLIIEFKGKNLIPNRILLTLGKQEINEKSAKFLSLLPAEYVESLSEKFYGFGMAKMAIDIPDLEDFIKDHKQTFYMTDKEYKPIAIAKEGEGDGGCSDCSQIVVCTAGGAGASSCSSGSNSVTCDGDCNACCTTGSAKCCSEESTPEL